MGAPDQSQRADDSTSERTIILAGKYRVLAPIGRGGMAEVFLCAVLGPANVNKLVVVKRLREGSGDSPMLRAMFLDEARVAARLNHPNVVQTYEVHEIGAEYIIVMEYLEGQSLRDMLKTLSLGAERCDPALAAHVMIEALNGLHYLHEVTDYDGSPLSIVHRDVSPQNLFLTYEGQVKLLDFGVAKGALNATETQNGVLKGKFAYMSPEQATGDTVDRRSDVFAAGVVLWELLTTKRLFSGDGAKSLLQILANTVAPPSALAPHVPRELDAIVLKALELTPANRFQSALDMSDALSSFLEASRQRPRQQDVARRMAQLFRAQREEMTRRVHTFMSAPYAAPPALESATTHPAPVVSPAPQALPVKHRLWLSVLVVGLVGAAGALAALRGGRARAPAPPLPVTVDNRKASEPDECFHLTLTSDPAEARVEWNGKLVGQTPLLIDLLPGSQTFVLGCESCLNVTVLVNVTASMAGRSDSRAVTLPARVAANSVPVANRARSRSTGASKERGGAATRDDSDGFDLDGYVADPPPDGSANAAPALSETAAPLSTLVALPSAAPTATASSALAASKPSQVAVLPFGANMTRPVLLSGAELVVPREARVANISGTMIARCTVTAEGLLRSCVVLKGLPFLDQPLLDSLATRRYRPVSLDGKPVAVQYVFNIKVEQAGG